MYSLPGRTNGSPRSCLLRRILYARAQVCSTWRISRPAYSREVPLARWEGRTGSCTSLFAAGLMILRWPPPAPASAPARTSAGLDRHWTCGPPIKPSDSVPVQQTSVMRDVPVTSPCTPSARATRDGPNWIVSLSNGLGKVAAGVHGRGQTAWYFARAILQGPCCTGWNPPLRPGT